MKSKTFRFWVLVFGFWLLRLTPYASRPTLGVSVFVLALLTLHASRLTAFGASGCGFPNTLDTFANVITGQTYTATLHNVLQCAAEKLEAELGINPKASFDSVSERLDNLAPLDEPGGKVPDLHINGSHPHTISSGGAPSGTACVGKAGQLIIVNKSTDALIHGELHSCPTESTPIAVKSLGDGIVSIAGDSGPTLTFPGGGQLVFSGATTATSPNRVIVTGGAVKSLTFRIGSDVGSALANTDDEATMWRNNVAPMTITEVWCESVAGSPIINLQRDDGTPANILSSDLTCSTTGATGTIAGAEDNIAVGNKIDFVMVTAGGTATRVTVNIKMTVD